MGLKDLAGGLPTRRNVKSGHPILDALLSILTKKGAIDGLGALLGKFTNAGLGVKANSWVGTSGSLPLEPDEVEKALGADEVHRIAVRAGVSRDVAKSGLAEVIPSLVDQMTPSGTLPTGDLALSIKGLDLSSIVGP